VRSFLKPQKPIFKKKTMNISLIKLKDRMERGSTEEDLTLSVTSNFREG